MQRKSTPFYSTDKYFIMIKTSTSGLCLTLVLLLMCSVLTVQGQHLSKEERMARVEGMTPVLTTTPGEVSVPYAEPSFYQERATAPVLTGENIGTSTYDLQTNHTGKNRLYVRTDGTVSAVWTGSTDVGGTWGDRGTFFNHYDGTDWDAFPTARIEGLRTGWPVLVNSGAKDIMFAHDFGSADGGMVMYESPAGAGTWTETIGSGGILEGIWPQAFHEEGSSFIHLTTSNYLGATGNNFTLYSRSPDGGTTWDILNQRLPDMDTVSGYNVVGADNTNITQNGNTVAIVSASSVNDLAVWVSNANGDLGSWSKTVILDFPIDNFDGNDITDVDGDGYADQIETTDGAHSVLVDNAGNVHVWSGYMVVTDETPGDGNWSFFPGVTGIWYWNSTFPADSVQYWNVDIDWDMTGDPIDGIGTNIPNYNSNSSSHFGVAHDRTNDDIYLVVPLMVESTDFIGNPADPNAQSFRDLFGMYSTDNGATWTSPVNLTLDAMEEFESTYPSVGYQTVGGAVHVSYMRDFEPGISVLGDTDPIGENAFVYQAFDFSAFDPPAAVPTANFMASITDNTVNFNNLTENGIQFVWDFEDGGLSNGEDPTYIFEEIGTYNVCLTATNIYGDDEYCEEVEITSIGSGLDILSLDRSVSLFPNPAVSTVTLDWNEQIAAQFDVQILDVAGRAVKALQQVRPGMSLDVSDLAAGVYHVQMHTDGASITRNLVIQQ